MAQTYCCKLDSDTGLLPQPISTAQYYRISISSTLIIELDCSSKYFGQDTQFAIDLQKYQGNDDHLLLEGQLTDFGHWFIKLNFQAAGSYSFYIQNGQLRGQVNYIVVEPCININGQEIPESVSFMQGIVMQSVLSRQLGPIQRWKQVFQSQIDIGYNMFHLAPIQELGPSGSLYCIKDHFNLNPDMFPDQMTALDQLKDVVKEVEKAGAGCLIDIVLNHCAPNCIMLERNTEFGYTLNNSPYLNVVFELDQALMNLSQDIFKGKCRDYNRTSIRSQTDLSDLMKAISKHVLPQVNIYDYFRIDVDQEMRKYGEVTAQAFDVQLDKINSRGFVNWIQKNAIIGEGEARNSTYLDLPKIKYVAEQLRIQFDRQIIQALDNNQRERVKQFETEILNNINGDILYHKVQCHNFEITPDNQLLQSYFNVINGVPVLCNGFVMNNKDVTQDIASKHLWYYLQRKVVVWSDNVKLRYGQTYSDNPELWDYIERYVYQMAQIFKGVRLDNAHGTPIAVSTHMLNAARMANSNCYVMAELFTGSQKLDKQYVEKLGINSLVREALNGNSTQDLSGMAYTFGNGDTSSLGSMEPDELSANSLQGVGLGFKRFIPKSIPAIWYDITHDNETFGKKRTFQDSLPTAAIVGFCSSAIASTWGFDELYSINPSVVTETRLYWVEETNEQALEISGRDIQQEICWYDNGNAVEIRGDWDQWKNSVSLTRSGRFFKVVLGFAESDRGKEIEFKYIVDGNWTTSRFVNIKESGHGNNFFVVGTELPKVEQGANLVPFKSKMNKLHLQMSLQGFTEIFVYVHNQDCLMIIRQNPTTLESYCLMARNAFHLDSNYKVDINDVQLPGIVKEVIGIYTFDQNNIRERPQIDGFLVGQECTLDVTLDLGRYAHIQRLEDKKIDMANFFNVPMSFVAILRTQLDQGVQHNLNQLVESYGILENTPNFSNYFDSVKLEDINLLLWSCKEEELDRTGNGLYGVQGNPDFVYAGIGGLIPDFLDIIKNNDLGNRICDNIRQGNWLIQYICNRLAPIDINLRDFIIQAYKNIEHLPEGVKPKHLVKLTVLLFRAIQAVLNHKLFKGTLYPTQDSLVQQLSLASTQFYGDVPSARCPRYPATISAGLPHFSKEYMRCWGRDTFIAMRGLLLITGRFEEAKNIILTFASVMRHGLIPNLLDACNNPRFNARDATWWFLQAIQDYILLKDDTSILKEEVVMVFKSDDQQQHQNFTNNVVMKLEDIIQQILQKHADGIDFREWNEGTRIDAHMKHEGFQVNVRVDRQSGLIFGGNRWNCGTWMDKMGSSEKAGNRGVPSTPRDGAAIEINGLAYSCIKFLKNLNEQSHFPYSQVSLQGEPLTYEAWADKILHHFEQYYWLPNEGYFKDTFQSWNLEADDQLRPNQAVALAIAPDLFTKSNAQLAIQRMQEHLLPELGKGQLGIKTLSPQDRDYRPNYDNSNDSQDRAVAHGANYHNGPEWVWPVGYFLRAAFEFEELSRT